MRKSKKILNTLKQISVNLNFLKKNVFTQLDKQILKENSMLIEFCHISIII